MAYHEITGSRRYEYRHVEDGRFTGWQDAGDAVPETLASIAAGLPDTEYEVQLVCAVSDDDGSFVGRLVFAQLVARVREP